MAFGRKKRQDGDEIDAGTEDRGRLTPVDVQQKVFGLAFRGYNEQDVDRFLDQVTEDLAALHEENKRLREEVELRSPGGGTEEARRHAEEIIRRAREEAAQIAAGRGAAGPAPAAYLARERGFLQSLAALVQEHAGSLKAEAHRARQAASREDEDAAPEDADAEDAAPEDADAEEDDEPRAAVPVVEETAPMPPPGEPGDLSEWSNPFVSEEGTGQPEPGEGDDQEPSLRELFWGEE